MTKKVSLIELLVHKNRDKTREILLAHILCGDVWVDEEKCFNPKALVQEESNIQIKIKRQFVSRGGKKLNSILDNWHIDVKGKTILDAGCSTGGFTDCLLKRGAAFIYAVDVGVNQLDYSLRVNPKVEVMEKVNITQLKQEMFSKEVDAAVMDLSFRSIRGAASHLITLIKEKWIIALIKPQFEWQNPGLEFDGVIREKKHYYPILTSLIAELKQEGVFVTKMALSALKGMKGNNEFFFLLEPEKKKSDKVLEKDIAWLLRNI
jgi:23S rRNA (cytidine1920-2'-O)/16S rRNA (cytidine1409-2'-O)-methyltransferase